MPDDQNWRLKADLGSAHDLDEFLDRVRSEPAGDTQIAGDVVITHDGKDLFAYAASEGSIDSARAAIRSLTNARIVISHWEQSVDDWIQVDPPLSGEAKRREEAGERDEGAQEHRTLVCSAGRMVRREIEQSMQESAGALGLKLQIIEHPHLLTCQVLFEVEGPKHKVDEFANGLKEEEMETIRTERAVMMSPL
jgi:hypothetical protein